MGKKCNLLTSNRVIQGMASKLITLLTMFVLTWTSTFLHDLAEGLDDQNIHNQADCADSCLNVHDNCQKPSIRLAEGEHVHLACITSKQTEFLNQILCLSTAFYSHSVTCNHLSVGAATVRAPPSDNLICQNKFYIANRRLLI